MKNVLEYLENIDSNNKIRDGKLEITYQELENGSKRIGSALLNYVEKNKPVPIYMEKGIPCLEMFMGSLYAGGFYCLLNVGLPKARLEQIMNVLNVDYLVTDKEHYEAAKDIFDDKKIYLYEELKENNIDEIRLRDIRNKALDVDPVYANFTSGSTGVPKGVLVSHRSIIDFIDVFALEFGITGEDVIGNQAPFDFDVSVKDIYTALKTGASLVIIPKDLFSKPALLVDYIIDNNVTTLIWAVSALCLISTFHGLDYKTPEKINKVLFSGEVMPMKHLKAWMEHLPKAKFVNLYGPTEITCNCTYHVIDRDREYEKIPIGIPFKNEDVFLVKDGNMVIDDNEVGEICIRGTALSLGYYRNKEQTSKSFVQNPLHDDYIDLVYRTGDLGYFVNGELYFSGRIDFQVKYMGHRIELEEIDKYIGALPGVDRVATIFLEEKSKLVAFYIGDIDSKELHEKLKRDLPIFMVPGKFVKLEEMPLSKNGKIDRGGLKKLI